RIGTVAVDGHLVAPHSDVDVGEGVLDLTEQLIALAEETGHDVVTGDEDLDRGACHVCSACDTTSGPGEPGRTVRPCRRRRPAGAAQPGDPSRVRPPRT